MLHSFSQFTQSCLVQQYSELQVEDRERRVASQNGHRCFQKAGVEVESPLIIYILSRVLNPLASVYYKILLVASML